MDLLGGVPLRADLVDDVRLFLEPVGGFFLALEHPERAVVAPLAARAEPDVETLDGLALQRKIQRCHSMGCSPTRAAPQVALDALADQGWRRPQLLR